MSTVPWPTVRGYRDQFTAVEERAMDDRLRWEEDHCTCVDEASVKGCRVHGDPEVIGLEQKQERPA